jgi:hypothetical protein
MGKETQFSRVEVAPVVAENLRWDFKRCSGDRCHEKIRDGFERNSFRTIRLPQLGLT